MYYILFQKIERGLSELDPETIPWHYPQAKLQMDT